MMIPKNTTIERWASSLIVDFPNDNIPLRWNESNWKSKGNALVQETSFANNAAPGTKDFNDWKTWAYAIFKSMANF